MLPDLTLSTRRVAGVREAVARSAPAEVELAHVEDVLTEGYAWALAGDGWLMQAEQGALERASALEQARVGRELMALRRELAALRADRDRLYDVQRERSA